MSFLCGQMHGCHIYRPGVCCLQRPAPVRLNRDLPDCKCCNMEFEILCMCACSASGGRWRGRI